MTSASFPCAAPCSFTRVSATDTRRDAGVPDELKAHSPTLDAYGPGRRLVQEIRIDGMAIEDEIEQLLARDDIEYIHVRDTSAGCYDFRVERAPLPAGRPPQGPKGQTTSPERVAVVAVR
jgi:hypothetical protein